MTIDTELTDNKGVPIKLGQLYYQRECRPDTPSYARYFFVTDLTPGREMMEGGQGNILELTSNIAITLVQAEKDFIEDELEYISKVAETFKKWLK